MTNFIIGDIGNTITKICLVQSKNYKIKRIIYIDSKKIYSKKNFGKAKLFKLRTSV